MPIAQAVLPEFENEMATTRRLLERVPEERAEWKPHIKSMSLGNLAAHLANLLVWVPMTLRATEFDFDPPGGSGPMKSAPFVSTAELLRRFDENVRTARETIAATSDDEMMVKWSLKNAGHTVVSLPRAAVLRSFVMNHLIHHRGQLSVYLRLNDVPLPGIYGPTADEA